MGTCVQDLFRGALGQLRFEPTEKRIRGTLAGQTVVDSHRAALVWEPKRVVPSYSIPLEDIAADLETSDDQSGEAETVLLDFGAFDAWYEEDEPNLGHPRDPFHRIEIVRSSRHVLVERDGEPIAESADPYLLFESMLPVRYYVRPQDVVARVLRPSETTSLCAYKGRASYWSMDGDDDVAWSYAAPVREAAEVKDRLAFFNERVDLVIDGERRERPITPWSPR